MIFIHSEDCKVSHYIINKVQQDNKTKYRIGDQFFPDLIALVEFYKLHYLNTTPLIRPAPRTLQTVIAKYDFRGNVCSRFYVHYIQLNLMNEVPKVLLYFRIPMICLSKKVMF